MVTRRVSGGGRISLATFKYYVGRWLDGETVEVAITEGVLIEVTHRGVLIASHVRQHPLGFSRVPEASSLKRKWAGALQRAAGSTAGSAYQPLTLGWIGDAP